MRGPRNMPELIASRISTVLNPPRESMSRTVVKPASRSTCPLASAISVRLDGELGWFRLRWTWPSIIPGSTVAEPRSITVAPAGTGRPAPTSAMRSPRTMMTGFASILPHLRPLLDFPLDQSVQGLGCAAGERYVDPGRRRLHVLKRQHFVDFVIELADHSRRRFGGNHHAGPGFNDHVGKTRFDNRGYIRQRLCSLRAHHGKHAYPAALHERHGRLKHHHASLHMTRN